MAGMTLLYLKCFILIAQCLFGMYSCWLGVYMGPRKINVSQLFNVPCHYNKPTMSHVPNNYVNYINGSCVSVSG